MPSFFSQARRRSVAHAPASTPDAQTPPCAADDGEANGLARAGAAAGDGFPRITRSATWQSLVGPPSDRTAAEDALLRKLDRRLLPLVCCSYLVAWLDRINVANARTLNNDHPGSTLSDSIGLQGMRYSFAVAAFMLTYALFEVPSNFLMKHFTPSKWLARIMFTWSIVAVCQAGATSYPGFLVARAALGLAEAGFFPGVIFYFTFWYRPEEQAKRLAIFAATNALAGSFGGALATAISFLDGRGGLRGWQYLFIIEGVPGFVLALGIWFYLPDFPQTASFLTEEERELAIKRLSPSAPRMSDRAYSWTELKKAMRNVDFWLFSLGLFLMVSSLTASAYFLPTILAEMGFRGWRLQLMTVPPNAVAFFLVIANAVWSDRRRERVSHTLLGLVVISAGYLLLAVAKPLAPRLVGCFLIANTNLAVIPFLALRTATIGGSTGTAAATGFSIALTNLNGIAAPFAFGTRGGLAVGNWTVFAFQIAAIGVVLLLWYRIGASACARDFDDDLHEELAVTPELALHAPAVGAALALEQTDRKEKASPPAQGQEMVEGSAGGNTSKAPDAEPATSASQQ